MSYKHGVYGVIEPSEGLASQASETVAVYVGLAPVHLLPDWSKSVNKPIRISSFDEAKAKLGYLGSGWDTYTLCEAIAAHFGGETGTAAGPIYCINVLDPATHKDADATEITGADISSGRYEFASTDAIVSTVRVADKVLDTDYTVNYVNGKVVITALTTMTASETITYTKIKTSSVTKTTIIGAKAETGNTGLYAINSVYEIRADIPAILACPKWSETPDVYEAMLAASTQINGHWEAFVVADIPILDGSTAVDTKAKAITWKSTNAYTSKRSKVCWPQVKAASGDVYHLSTLVVAMMQRTDAGNDGIPMESVSNKAIGVTACYFGADSTTVGYDQEASNGLNEKGITTAAYWGGSIAIWGDHTAAYQYGAENEPDAIFDVNMRMLMYIVNQFQARHGAEIDTPMTIARKDSIVNAEQAELDALVGMGALIGSPRVEFRQNDNPIDNLVSGDFVFAVRITATPPLKSLTARVTYTTEGFTAFIESLEGGVVG